MLFCLFCVSLAAACTAFTAAVRPPFAGEPAAECAAARGVGGRLPKVSPLTANPVVTGGAGTRDLGVAGMLTLPLGWCSGALCWHRGVLGGLKAAPKTDSSAANDASAEERSRAAAAASMERGCLTGEGAEAWRVSSLGASEGEVPSTAVCNGRPALMPPPGLCPNCNSHKVLLGDKHTNVHPGLPYACKL